MKIASGLATLAVLIAIVAFLGYLSSEHTSCFTDFATREAADRAASAGREAGHDADLEPSGPNERKRSSQGGRRIAVTFRDGETGEDAKDFRRTVAETAEREGVSFNPNHCIERSRFD
jgi:hypothetical protein